jgi:hypothetical protein
MQRASRTRSERPPLLQGARSNFPAGFPRFLVIPSERNSHGLSRTAPAQDDGRTSGAKIALPDRDAVGRGNLAAIRRREPVPREPVW